MSMPLSVESPRELLLEQLVENIRKAFAALDALAAHADRLAEKAVDGRSTR